MSSLSPREKRKLEDLFGMSSGYVLDFSNNSFARFFEEEVNRDIYGGAYSRNGSSKANHLRSFWTREDDSLVGRVIHGLLEHCRDTGHSALERQALFRDCEAIAARLAQAKPVEDIEAIDGDTDRKSTRLNSSHSQISYAVFCLKKKKDDSVMMPIV